MITLAQLNRDSEKDGKETPEDVAFNRRKWMIKAGLGVGGVGLAGGLWWWTKFHGTDDQVIAGGETKDNRKIADFYPAERDARFTYDRTETSRVVAARFTNFYEFSKHKNSWNLVGDFQPEPWSLRIDGLCTNPLTIDMPNFHRQFAKHLSERLYRHGCVEKWAMAIPWTGVPLSKVLEAASPVASATHVRFVSFNRPNEAPNQRNKDEYPWPYNEGLTIEEAKVDLAFLAVGMYGKPLLKQHGAPIRLVIPWKYGFKSIKSIQRIEFVNKQPATFWNELMPRAYPFESNVDPMDTIPWDQSHEEMLGSRVLHKTLYLNGYQKEVGHLYRKA